MPNKALKILIVDDDPRVANALRRGLHKHEPTIETDPAMAYRRLSDGEWFDAVVCDAKMPGLGGEHLLAAARELPDPPIFVLMTGDESVREPHADVTLHKPFTARQLLDILEIFTLRKARATTQLIELLP